jgi:hypothetical protein
MITFRLLFQVATIAFALTPTLPLSAEERMRAGLWELTITVDGHSKGNSHDTCFTPGMLELTNSPAKLLREATEKAAIKGGHCSLKDYKLDGNAISTTMVCGAKTLVTASTYSLDTFDTVNTSTEAGVSIVTHIKGRFRGACK